MAKFDKNKVIWATSTDDVDFYVGSREGGFDITFNLQNYESSTYCRFYLKW